MLSYDEMNKISDVINLVKQGTIKKAEVKCLCGTATIYSVKEIVRIDIKGETNE